MRVLGYTLVATAVAAVAAGCGGSAKAKAGPPGPVQHPSSLVGVVGHNDAFSISLTDPQGHPISNLAAGTYKLSVRDESTIHNFHLSGPGLDRSTPVGSVLATTFTVTFKPGTYSFVCDPHSAQMHGRFTVT